ncbi:MAG TPA: DUF4412 domain-containing protein [Terriglobales bacterium]
MTKRTAVLSLAFAVLGTIAAIGQAAPAQFSADMVMHSPRGNNMNGKFFFGGTRTRTDMTMPDGGSMSTITNVPEKKVFIVMHQRRMYMEHDVNQAAMMGRGPRTPEIKEYDPNNPCSNMEGTTCKKVGAETVNGRNCEKWEFSKNGQLEETKWIDRKLRVPIKTVREDGTTYEFQNLKEEAQPDSVFEIPAGYQKMDMGNMMRGMGKQR